MNAIATFPRKQLFAKITEPIQRWAIESLAKGAERELWEFLSRRSAGKFGVEIEVELKDIAQFLLKAFRTTYRAFKALVTKGFCEITRTLSGYGYRVVLLVPKGCEVDQNCADTLPVLSHLGHSNPHSTVTSIRDLKEKQTGEGIGLENSPEQKEGLRSPLPKPKLRNQDPQPESELTEALSLVVEYGNRTGDRNLETKSRVKKAISNIARNLSPEKLIERVRNAIAATEEQRSKGGVKCLEGLLSDAISKGYTLNSPKQAERITSLGGWLREVNESFPNSIYRVDLQGVDVIYRTSDQSLLGTFEELRDLPIEEIGRLINPPTPSSQLPSESLSELSEGIKEITPDPSDNSSEINPDFSERISAVEAESQVIADPTPQEPTEDELSDAIAYSRCYEERLGISPQDRPSAIQRLIGVNVRGLGSLTDLQRVQYYQALVRSQ